MTQFVIFTMAVALVISTPLLWRGIRRKANHDFKSHAIAQIQQWSAGKTWEDDGVAFLDGQQGEVHGPSWLSDHLIRMTNGDWIVYFQACTKSNWKVDDMFIGRGSDGKWYYTTYHFCIGMFEIAMRLDAPSSLREFIGEYYAREFNGEPDETLKRTWPEEDVKQ